MPNLISEVFVQQLAGAEDMRFYSSDWKLQHCCDLFVAALLRVAQTNDSTVFFGQSRNGFIQQPCPLVSDEIPIRFI